MDDAKDELIIEPDFELVKNSVKSVKEPFVKVVKSIEEQLSPPVNTSSYTLTNTLADDIKQEEEISSLNTLKTLTLSTNSANSENSTNPNQYIAPFYISMFYKENRTFLIHIISDLILFYFFFSYIRNQFYITEQMIQLAKKRIIEYKESKGLQ